MSSDKNIKIEFSKAELKKILEAVDKLSVANEIYAKIYYKIKSKLDNAPRR